MAILSKLSRCFSRGSRACRLRCGLHSVLCVLLVMAVGWLGRPLDAVAEEVPVPEQVVKAAFILNFPKYVEWPAEAFARSNSPIVIAVLGETKVTAEIQKVIAGRSVNGREIVLKRVASGEE